MSELYKIIENVDSPPKRIYWDRKSCSSLEQWRKMIAMSTTVYVGNISFYTTESQIWELFSKCGYVKQVVMGLNAVKKIPCGFCFVVFTDSGSCDRAVNILNNSIFDDRIMRVDKDVGGSELEKHRRFGRGAHGLQWRDEFRKYIDVERGGEGGGLDYDAFQTNALKRKRSQIS